MKTAVYSFAALSAVGLALSAASHAAALWGAPEPLGAYTAALHVGVFGVFLAAVLAANRLADKCSPEVSWKAIFRECPDWMQYMTYAFCVYALVNLALYAIGGHKRSASVSPRELRGFSGGWMAFYSISLAILYSAAKLWDEECRCSNGHTVAPRAKFCDRCGQPITGLGSRPRGGR